MATRSTAKPKAKPAAKAAATAGKALAGSVQQAWAAGMGALARVQTERGKLIESLLKEGLSLNAKTRKIAGDKIREVRGAVEAGADQAREHTQEAWLQLEQVFETSLSRSLQKLGVPTRRDIELLIARIDRFGVELQKIGSVRRSGFAESIAAPVRRARDDFGDLVKDIEEAQLAAKQGLPRVGETKTKTKTVETAPVPAKKKAPPRKAAPAPAKKPKHGPKR